MRCLTTTTIGSFPLPSTIDNFKLSIEVQAKVGIDYPALPQLKDFCEVFLQDIAERGRGLQKRGNNFMLVGPVEAPKEPAITQEVALAISKLRELGRELRLKVQVTGPLTLSSAVRFMDKTAMSYPDVAESFADALAEILAAACSYDNVEVAFVDEPVLYHALWYGYDEKTAASIINRTFKRVDGSVERGIHVCGDAMGLHRVTLKLDVDVIHHEVMGFPRNLEAYDQSQLLESGKMLGIGAVTTRPIDVNIRIEGESEIEELLNRALERYGISIVVAPDCGFRGLLEQCGSESAFEVALKKMDAMVRAVRGVRAKLRLESND
ncbi:MAG: hypothetical protein QFX33_04935 [Candidatus Nezhaarchaeota archaeon]|nr:hypothetical protein [Candidatus Nezhaarchaeota archaeon]